MAMAIIALLAAGCGKPTKQGCTMDAKVCPDGSAVGRVGPGCEFAECPKVENAETATGTQEILKNDAAIEPAEAEVTSKTCPREVKVCQDGSTVMRILPDCEFAECPEPKEEKVTNLLSAGCSSQTKICSDGTVVGRQGVDCEFAQCPS